jgi:hypothetical protein
MIDNGGTAFPISFSPSYPNEIVGGMTLRDYFAAKAMQGFAVGDSSFTNGIAGMAECAYKWADAMIKQRNKQGE